MFKTLTEWIASSLNRKFITGTAAGLVAFSFIFLALFIGMYQGQLKQQRSIAAEQVNRLLQTSLEAAMLRRDLDMLRSIVTQFGNQQGINGAVIIDRGGEIRFSNHPDLLGSHPRIACDHCDFDPANSISPFSYFTRDSAGTEVLRTVHPVLNQPPCKECHGPAELHPINGTLVVDHDASTIEQHARGTTLLLMGAGSIVVFVNLIGGWWFIRRFVLLPIGHLEQASHELTSGNLSSRVIISGQDELSQLGTRFNRMAATLERQLQEIKDKEAFLQGLVDANPDGIRVIDKDYNVRLVNRAYCKQLDLTPEQALRETCHLSSHGLESPCVPTLISCPLKEIEITGVPVKVMHRHVTGQGNTKAVEIYAAPMQIPQGGKSNEEAGLIVESIRDLGQVMQVSHEQKLSEIGRLSAGVAHEIHNPLASVRLALDSAIRFGNLEEIDVPGKIQECMELVDREINRCIEVTERLLKMSMFSGGETQILSLNRSVDETLSLLEWEAAEDGIAIAQELDSSEPRLIANESDIRIIVLNLVQNAFHAMPDGGKLTISTRREKGRIAISFADTGVGIPIEDLQRIFDPFFSNRADHKQGTGLGLSISLNLAERHKGRIKVDSVPGEGSQFTLDFPDPDWEEHRS